MSNWHFIFNESTNTHEQFIAAGVQLTYVVTSAPHLNQGNDDMSTSKIGNYVKCHVLEHSDLVPHQSLLTLNWH